MAGVVRVRFLSETVTRTKYDDIVDLIKQQGYYIRYQSRGPHDRFALHSQPPNKNSFSKRLPDEIATVDINLFFLVPIPDGAQRYDTDIYTKKEHQEEMIKLAELIAKNINVNVDVYIAEDNNYPRVF